jgi:acetyl esterase/lipase
METIKGIIMKSKFTIICGSLVLALVLSSISTFPQVPGTSNYEKDYRKYVDSLESFTVLQNRDIQVAESGFKYTIDSRLMPNHTIKYGPHQLQQLDIYVHHQSNTQAPVIIYIHSGASDKLQVKVAVPSWLSLGYTVVSINHRMDSKLNFTQHVEDCFLALKWVMDSIHEYGGDGNRIVLTGFSVGGHMTALMVTGTKWHNKYGIDISKIKCWIPMSGFYSMDLQENYLSPAIAGYLDFIKIPSKKDADPCELVSGKEPPSLIIHGSDDWAVPKTNAAALHNKLKENGSVTELAILKGYLHADIFWTYYREDSIPAKLISRFLAKYVPTEENH